MKNIKYICVLLAMVLLGSFVLAGCDQKSPTDTKSSGVVTLYFGNADQSDLVTEPLDIPDDTENALEYTLEKLLDGPTKSDNHRIIRAGTDLISVNMDEQGLVTVNFTKEFYNNESITDVLAASSVVKTLCSFSDVKKVDILVEGKELVGPNQTPLGEMKDEDLVFEAGGFDGEDETTVKLYFSDNEAMYLGSELRRVETQQKESTEKIIMQELLKGPQSKELVRTIPAEAKLLSVETKDGVCFVNLSNEFITKHGGGSAGEQMTIFSIVNSLTELSHIEKVQFLIEGKKKDVFINMIFNEPFERDVSMISKN